jgi:hypothetical protein
LDIPLEIPEPEPENKEEDEKMETEVEEKQEPGIYIFSKIRKLLEDLKAMQERDPSSKVNFFPKAKNIIPNSENILPRALFFLPTHKKKKN